MNQMTKVRPIAAMDAMSIAIVYSTRVLMAASYFCWSFVWEGSGRPHSWQVSLCAQSGHILTTAG